MIKFEELAIQDIPVIAAMMEEFYAIDGYDIDHDTTVENFHHFVSDPQLGQAWLIREGADVLGYMIVVYFFSFEFKGLVGLLDELFIHENARGKGAGKLAVEFANSFLESKQCKLILLEVEQHNKPAIHLYEKNGFSFHPRRFMRKHIN
ncbi:GNAT family N-acetyltransferase [Sphingobacterium sp. N143]|uniref:GNAT family N-acetyltransferase n=1 Tax=Sphingobacterium sp. N143 TaxID=2746727 RepID=UPI002576777D|nr:GNAT family N-acetyltransferase [Sphingobacterium sp. N143]MDM1296774.1 GNAT family N-acetyltransferase [Sphingobacterium sp. N143]